MAILSAFALDFTAGEIFQHHAGVAVAVKGFDGDVDPLSNRFADNRKPLAELVDETKDDLLMSQLGTGYKEAWSNCRFVTLI